MSEPVIDVSTCPHIDFDEWMDGSMKCRACGLLAFTCPDCGEAGSQHAPDCLVIAEEIRRQEDEAMCCDCERPLGNAESMVRNNGRLSHLEKCPDPPTLAQNAAEAQRMLIAGRQDYCLKEARVYDHTRAEQGPLFKDKGGLF